MQKKGFKEKEKCEAQRKLFLQCPYQRATHRGFKKKKLQKGSREQETTIGGEVLAQSLQKDQEPRGGAHRA